MIEIFSKDSVTLDDIKELTKLENESFVDESSKIYRYLNKLKLDTIKVEKMRIYFIEVKRKNERAKKISEGSYNLRSSLNLPRFTFQKAIACRGLINNLHPKIQKNFISFLKEIERTIALSQEFSLKVQQFDREHEIQELLNNFEEQRTQPEFYKRAIIQFEDLVKKYFEILTKDDQSEKTLSDKEVVLKTFALLLQIDFKQIRKDISSW